MNYEIFNFHRRDLPEIIFSKQLLETLKLENLSSEIQDGFKSQYFKEKEYWVCSDGKFAYLQNKSEKYKFRYYKLKDWTREINETLSLQNYLARLKNTKIIDSKSALYPDWSNVDITEMKSVAVPVRDACGIFLFLSQDNEIEIEIDLYERDLSNKNKLVKLITLADFNLIAKS